MALKELGGEKAVCFIYHPFSHVFKALLIRF
jgi:hypothetical protein